MKGMEHLPCEARLKHLGFVVRGRYDKVYKIMHGLEKANREISYTSMMAKGQDA